MICAACPREARGFGWFDARVSTINGKRLIKPVKQYPACSVKCVDILERTQGQMDNMTQTEIDAMYAASEAGGQYIDALGKSDLATLMPDEYMQFIDAVVTGYVDAMQASTGRIRLEEIPY